MPATDPDAHTRFSSVDPFQKKPFGANR